MLCSIPSTSILRLVSGEETGREGGEGTLNSMLSKLVYGLGNGTTCAANGRFSSLDGKLENVCRINLQPRI